MSGLRSSRYLLEAPMVIRMVLAVQKHLQMTNMIILDHFGLNNFIKKINPCGCPGLCPPGTCWRLPWWSGWSWLSGNTFKLPMLLYLTTFAWTTVSKNQFLGMSGLRSSRNLLVPPILIRARNPEFRAPWGHTLRFSYKQLLSNCPASIFQILSNF